MSSGLSVYIRKPTMKPTMKPTVEILKVEINKNKNL